MAGDTDEGLRLNLFLYVTHCAEVDEEGFVGGADCDLVKDVS